MTLPIFIGYDSREREAYDVAYHSFASRAMRRPVDLQRLDAAELYQRRLLWRPVERADGRMYDRLSDAPQSTEFATSRFLLPFLQRTGWALFVDCDVVCLSDPGSLLDLVDDQFAVMCVRHPPYVPASEIKMDGQRQTTYPRKNWSSLMLVNCDHPAHHRLTLGMVNWWPGELLHRFAWLRDSEIGALPAGWNWLVGEQPRPETVHLAHFTRGGPWIAGWPGAEHDEVWYAERHAASHHAAAG